MCLGVAICKFSIEETLCKTKTPLYKVFTTFLLFDLTNGNDDDDDDERIESLPWNLLLLYKQTT